MRTNTDPSSNNETTTHNEDTAMPTTKQPRQPGTSNLARTIGPRRNQYGRVAVEGKRDTQNNGDPIAMALLRVEFEALRAFGTTHFGRSYDHLNKGHERMCFGNLLRAAAKKGDQQVLEFLGLQAA